MTDNRLFSCVVIACFLGASIGFRTGPVLWFPLRILALAGLPVLLLVTTPSRPGVAYFSRRFFIFVVAYGLVSLCWSPDPESGFRSAALIFT